VPRVAKPIANGYGKRDSERFQNTLLVLWIGFLAFVWFLVTLGSLFASKVGITLNLEALDRIGYLWFGLILAGLVWGVISALHKDSSGVG